MLFPKDLEKGESTILLMSLHVEIQQTTKLKMKFDFLHWVCNLVNCQYMRKEMHTNFS